MLCFNLRSAEADQWSKKNVLTTKAPSRLVKQMFSSSNLHQQIVLMILIVHMWDHRLQVYNSIDNTSRNRFFLFLFLVQETVSTNPTEHRERRIVNYGPCVVCHVNKACILLIGCNHLACCGQCSVSCGNFCPIPNCNHPIIERLRVFEPVWWV